MAYFAALLLADEGTWRATEVSLDDCESIEDIADVAREHDAESRLIVIEQDDEYAVLARIDGDEDARVFLTDGHAADAYPLAALIADELVEIGAPHDDDADVVDDADDLDDEDDDAADEDELAADLVEVAKIGHDSAPFGDPSVMDDLGTSAAELLELCRREGTLPIDVIVAVCERAGCADVFEAVRS